MVLLWVKYIDDVIARYGNDVEVTFLPITGLRGE